jgi:hypothetical protein
VRILVRTLVGVTLVGSLYVATRVNWSNLDAQGVVRDYVTKQPVAGAKLNLDCRETHLSYTTSSIRTVQTISSQEGRYSFRFSDTWDCDYVVLIPEKPGYQNLFGFGVPNMLFAPFSATVPEHAWLVAESDGPRLRLEGWLETSRAVPMRPGLPIEDYMRVFRPFNESKRIAADPRDIGWVRAHYCERLAELYAKTSTPERKLLANSAYGADYEIHVRPYCNLEDAAVDGGSL